MSVAAREPEGEMPTLSGWVRRVVLGVMTLVGIFLVVWVSLRGRQLGAVGSAVFQAIVVVLSIYGAWVFIKDGTDQHVRAVAKASARRVLVNYSVIGGLAAQVSEVRDGFRRIANEKGDLDSELVQMALRGLEAHITSQLDSADAAIRDWRDLAPAEVDAEIAAIKAAQQKSQESR